MTHTIKNTLIPEESIITLMQNYDLSEMVSCKLLARGLNDTYLISTNKTNYIFRVYRLNWRNESDILFEIEALSHMKEKNQHISYPLKTKQDTWLTRINVPEGERYGVLFTYSEGERPEINKENCRLIGQSLGSIHNCTDSFKTEQKRSYELDFYHLIDEPLKVISPVIESLFGKEKVDFLDNIADKIKQELKSKNLEYGFCHGDYHNFNMHISGNNLEVFDFDCCGLGYRAYDVAVFWWNLKNNYPKVEAECWSAFLEGYLSQRQLSKEDIDSLPLFITVRRIWLVGTMLSNEDVWGREWITRDNLAHFLEDLKQDQEKLWKIKE
ncbi:hypothetical protein E3U55_03495 [Filobacillus milosensis]|uniref:Aminoglycoside phosphotransferase domain-containing protein n=1 Tax=Filobacillus milosensis TaxID=94137 RepID=A0A4Y8ISI2_9BACI|nr:phosphotransferase [Filobacillus milosensis]TFB23890.1 hypothetical protein E3U55_03495 [Filobacillus milosensis]